MSGTQTFWLALVIVLIVSNIVIKIIDTVKETLLAKHNAHPNQHPGIPAAPGIKARLGKSRPAFGKDPADE